MRRNETVRSDVDHSARRLRDDEVDAVCGGIRHGGDKGKYMEIKLVEVVIASV